MDSKMDYLFLKYMINNDRICFIHSENADDYIGNWVVGFGDINARFSKADTREMTSEEIKNYNDAAFCKTKDIHFPLHILAGGKIGISSTLA